MGSFFASIYRSIILGNVALYGASTGIQVIKTAYSDMTPKNKAIQIGLHLSPWLIPFGHALKCNQLGLRAGELLVGVNSIGMSTAAGILTYRYNMSLLDSYLLSADYPTIIYNEL
jgi:hypothetical protein